MEPPGHSQMMPRSAAISVAIDPVALVVTECITVTSAMRKHTRWAHSSVSAILGGGVPAAKLDTSKTSLQRRKSSGRKEKRDRTMSVTEDIGLAGRWGLRGKKGQSMQDNPLLAAFARLRSDLKRCKDIHKVDAPSILHPFLQVIRSSSTSAPITSLALIAITKFFAYNIISRESPQLPLAMQLLSSAVTHCRFEASDSATDEIVLFRILKLMEGMITGPGGEVLGDESMCEMMETGISMCCQVRLSELLRRSAEVSMVTMCQTIFQRLKEVEVEKEIDRPGLRRRSSSRFDRAADTVKMDPAIDGDLLASKQITSSENAETAEEAIAEEPLTEKQEEEEKGEEEIEKTDEKDEDKEEEKEPSSESATLVNGGGSQLDLPLRPSTDQDESQEIKPYSLPSIRELFRVLVGLLDPHDRQHNDTMRVMALRIVDVALEVAGPSIANHPSLASLAKDTLCRHLFQLVRSENIAILNESLRVAGTLLSTCRRVLKLQQELYLSYLVACLHPRVEIPTESGIDPALYDGVPQAPKLVKQASSQSSSGGSGRSTPVPVKDRQKLGMEGGSRKPDAREAMVENVGHLLRVPSFMVELFINYDCEIDRSDLCQDMIGLLSRNAFPDAATWSTTNVPPLCLDALLGYIQAIADRLEDEPDYDGYPAKGQLQEQRARKKVIIKGATKFNENPRAGILFLASQGMIEDADDPKSVAKFLKGTTRVDKRVMGDFLSKRSNEELLSAFMETFDFTDLRVDEALRQLLNSFRLPGEAALISRIVNDFAAKYFDSEEPEEITDKDALYVLTYAIIMLNTDQHNPNVKSQNRMSFNDFARNLRGVNGGKDFESDYLQEIYESIKTREIILPEEHDNKHSFDHAWKELLFKIQYTADLQICDTNVFDAEMFAATWKPLVATLSYVFMSATDDTVFSRVVTGFDQCAQIAATYGLHDCLDQIIFCLSSISTLAVTELPSTALNTEVQAGDRTVMVSETAVRFGREFKAQLATVVLFRLVIGHEAAIRGGWKYLTRIILNLFLNSLITNSYTAISSNTDIPRIPLQSPAQVIERNDRNVEGGLFSAFTSYVSSFANDEPPEPSDGEIENTLCTIDCVNACGFETLFANISRLPFDALKAFLKTLLSHIPEDASPRVIVVKPDIPAPTAVRPNGQKPGSVGLAYDPSLVFVLEFSTILAARDPETIEHLGKDVADALQNVVRDATHMHPVTLSRAVYYLLSFLRASHEHDFIRVPVVLHAISKFDQELLKQSAPFIVKGLLLCLNGAPGLRYEMVNSPDFWYVLQALQAVPETLPDVFAMVESVVDGVSPALTAYNYEPAVSLLNDFATAGSVGAAEEQRRDQAAKRGKPPKKPAPPVDAVVRGQRALQIVYQMTSRVPTFIGQSQLEPNEAWTTYWSPPFRTLTTHSLNPCRQIRSQSLSSLQRVLLSHSLAVEDDKAQTITLFTDVLFPLIRQLLKPEIWHSDPGGMGETRLQAALLCCKVYLRFLDTLLGDYGDSEIPTDPTPPMSPVKDAARTSGETPDDPTSPQPQPAETEPPPDGLRLWSQILQILERLIKSGANGADGLEEAVPESLKNIVLVMANGDFMAPPPSSAEDGPAGADVRTPLQRRLWELTWVRVERIFPGLMVDVFPGSTLRAPALVGLGAAVGKEGDGEGEGEGVVRVGEAEGAAEGEEEGDEEDEEEEEEEGDGEKKE